MSQITRMHYKDKIIYKGKNSTIYKFIKNGYSLNSYHYRNDLLKQNIKKEEIVHGKNKYIAQIVVII